MSSGRVRTLPPTLPAPHMVHQNQERPVWERGPTVPLSATLISKEFENSLLPAE